MPFKITIRGDIFTEADLKLQNDSEDPVISICYKWLNNIPIKIKTSGSTGKPKVIELNRELIEISAMKTIKFFNLRENSKALLCISPNYIGGIMMILRAILGKLHLTVTTPSSDPLENFKDSEFEFAAMVPLQLKSSIEEGRNLPKKLIIGGASVSYDLIEKVEKIKGSEIYSTYGMTETYSHIALKKLNEPNRSQYFSCLSGIAIHKNLVDNCLEVKGDITRNKIIKTNDICEITENGKFNILGRIDNIINSGGVKINPESIENRIAKLMKGLNYLIIGLPDEKLGEKVVLLIERNELDIKEDNLLITLSPLLDKYELPKEIIIIDRFQYTDSQKISRRLTVEKVISQDQN